MPPHPPSLPTVRRAAIAALALGLAVLSVLDHRAWSREQRRLYQLLASYGLVERQPAAAAELRRQIDRERAKLLAARLILASELDRSWLLELPEAERRAAAEGGVARLASARQLAAEAAARRPASWTAWMVVGAATYLERSRSEDRRLMVEAEAWEQPLRAARELAPAQPEPARFLASAYLGNWSRLGEDRREQARELLAAALRDPATFDRLIEVWLRLAPSFSSALSVVPDEHWAWDRLQRVFGANEDWERVAYVRGRWHQSNEAFIRQLLDEGSRRRRGGDSRMARRHYLQAVARSSPSPGHLPYLTRVLRELPGGPLETWDRESLGRWLDWVLEVCRLRSCPVEAPAIGRLARLVEPPEAARQAAAAVVAERLDAADGIERREAVPGTPGWDAYFVLKARALLLRRPDLALQALRSSRPAGAGYWLAALGVGEAAGDRRLLSDARLALERLAGGSVSFADWQTPAPRLFSRELYLPEPRHRLVVGLTGSGPGIVELRWDGDLLGVYPAAPGARLVVNGEFPAGGHRLQLAIPTGRFLGPGAARFEAAG